MLDLSSEQWANISASPGNDGTLTASLLRRLAEGDEDALDELYQQVCHQNTVGEVAFVTAPHLVWIARHQAPRLCALLLGTLGTIVASAATYRQGASKPRPEWVPDYERACDGARSLAAELLAQGGLDSDTSLQLIGALAALHGHMHLALLLERGPDLECPSCGEPVAFGDAG